MSLLDLWNRRVELGIDFEREWVKAYVESDGHDGEIDCDWVESAFRASNRLRLWNAGEGDPFQVFASLHAGQITVFRGVNGDGEPRGLSWSTSMDCACAFAIKHPGTPAPAIYVATLSFADVFCVLIRRGEFEIIGRPDECFRVAIPLLTIRQLADRYHLLMNEE